MTVWIYVDKNKDAGDKDHLKLFANEHAANEWFKKHDIPGKAFGYEIISSDMRPHVAQAYKDACDNLIYLKKEQFQVTYYTWLVLAAFYVLSRAFPGIKTELLWATCALGFLSIFILTDFQRAMKRFRDRLANIYADYFTKSERERLRLDATSSHWFIAGILYLSVVVATFFTAWAVYQPLANPPSTSSTTQNK
jgi:hypothetical protein